MKFKLLLTLSFIYCTTATEPVALRSIYDLMTENKDIKFYKCYDPIPFEYNPFPIAEYSYFQPNKGCFDQTGVFSIPYGKIYISDFYMLTDKDNHFIKDVLPTNYSLFIHFQNIDFQAISSKQLQVIPGTVAVITGLAYENYAHFITEILAKLQLLRIKNIEYDWLYIPHAPTFCKEILSLLNIDHAKLIQPHYDYIQAETLLIPSTPAKLIPQQNNHNYAQEHWASLYIPQWHLDWLRTTFIPIAEQQITRPKYSEKVFISRKDAPIRSIIKEDELFTFFESRGFTRYNLSDMSFLEQVHLFHHARYIVSPHGAGLTNVIFCNHHVSILEIFQNQFDSSFWYISQALQFDHHCIKPQERDHLGLKVNTEVSLENVKQYLNQHLPQL